MDWLTTLLADQALQNALLGLFGVLLTVIINRAAGAFEAMTGMRIERDARDALHSALRSGVEAALRNGPSAGLDAVKAHAILHARESVPDAIRILVPGEGVLDRIAVRYYQEALERAGVKLPSGGVANADAQRFLERGTS